MKIAVVGAGAAGVAAAWTASRAGHSVTVVHAGAGSSELYSGALDLQNWEDAPDHEHLETAVLELSRALGWVVSAERSAIVAGREGGVRRARGRESALLDLEPLKGKRIGVVDLERDDWDAPLLAVAFETSPWAVATHTRFEPVAVGALQRGSERRISAYDFAKLHDDPERARLFAAELARMNSGGVQALLTGPWLGIEDNLAARLSSELRMPVGETLSPPGGPAGARFERSRVKLLERLGILELRARALGLAPDEGKWKLELDHENSAILADAVILAVGGVAAGGVRMSGTLAGSPERGFRLSLEAPVDFELDGRSLEVSTLFGVDFTVHGISALERIGISVDERAAVRGAAGLYAAGDSVAGGPRTVLKAVIQGLRAAEAAISRG